MLTQNNSKRKQTPYEATFMKPLVVPSFMLPPETTDSAMR